MMAILDPDLLQTLASLADEGSFTRAGERLGLTQQAISAQVKRIEAAINRKIVTRRGARVRLTDDGEALLVYARRVLEISRQVKNHFSSVTISGSARIGITEGFASEGLPFFLASLRATHPDFDLVVETGFTEKLLLRQENGRLDLVLGIQRVGSSKGEALWTDRPRWIGEVKSLIQPASPVRLVTLPQPSLMRLLAIEALTRTGHPYQVVFESESRTSLRAASFAGLGAALFCRTLDDDVEFTEADGALPNVDPIEFFLRVTDASDGISRKVAELIRAAAASILNKRAQRQF